MYFHLIIHTLILIVTSCFGFEAACSMNKDDITLWIFWFSVLVTTSKEQVK